MRRMLQGVVLGVSMVLAGAALAGEGPAAPKPAPVKAKGPVEAKATFERLKALAGEWEGRVSEDAKVASVRYRLASGGTVVEETLFPGTPHEMISLYHLDGTELLLTHYCSGGNQPRLRLDRAASTPGELRFTFLDGTNLDPARDQHIHGLTLTSLPDGRLQHDWVSWANGKEEGHLRVALRRTGAAAAGPGAATSGHEHH